MTGNGKRSIVFSPGWCGTLLTIAIVALRALQPGAEPMSAWSASSWVWMTLPLTVPSAAGLVFLAAWAVAWIASTAFSRGR